MWEAPSLTNLLPRFCVTSHPMTRAALSMATVGPLAFAHPLLECSPYSSRCRTRRNIGSRFPCIYFPCKLPPRALTLWVYPVSKAAVKPSADSSSIRRLWRLPPFGLSTGTVTGPSTSTVTGRDFSTVTGRDFSTSTVTGPCSPLSRVPATPPGSLAASVASCAVPSLFPPHRTRAQMQIALSRRWAPLRVPRNGPGQGPRRPQLRPGTNDPRVCAAARLGIL